MAENTTLNTGSGGDTIAADDIGGVKFPRSKIVIGADGTNDGDVSSANPLPVTHGALTELAAAIDTEVQVDVVGSLPAGTNAIGKLAANSGVDIGDVDVTSFPSTVHSADYDSGAGTDTTLAFGIAVPASGGAAVIPGDATAGLKVDLGADNDVTVTGSVTANAGTNLNTSALALEAGGNLAAAAASLAILDNVVSGSEAQCDVITVPAPLSTVGGGTEATALRVTVASDSTGVLSVDDNSSSLTVDNAALSVVGGGTEATALRVTVASDSTGVLSVDDNGGALTVDNGGTFATQAQLTPVTSGGLSMSSVIGAATTNATVVKASAGQVYEIVVTNINAAAVYLKLYNKATTPDENDTPVWRMAIPGNTAGAGLAKTFPNGLAFGTGISYRLVGGVADNSTTAVSANEQLVNIGFK